MICSHYNMSNTHAQRFKIQICKNICLYDTNKHMVAALTVYMVTTVKTIWEGQHITRTD
jgi:hypothetical protein